MRRGRDGLGEPWVNRKGWRLQHVAGMMMKMEQVSCVTTRRKHALATFECLCLVSTPSPLDPLRRTIAYDVAAPCKERPYGLDVFGAIPGTGAKS